MSNTKTRIGTAIASAAVLAGGSLFYAAPSFAAAGGETTDTVMVRTAPNTSSTALSQVDPGTQLTLECQTSGEAVEGTYNSDQWARVTVNGVTGYVSRAYVTVPDGTGLGACDAAPAPEQPAPTAPAPAPTEPAPTAPAPGTLSEVDGPITRAEVLQRAEFWVSKKFTYSNYEYNAKPDPQGKLYRPDCSGMASMALHLGETPGTRDFGPYLTEISKDELKAGDMVANIGPGSEGDNGHIQIFVKWVDKEAGTYVAYEQTGGEGKGYARESVDTWGMSFYNRHAYRYNKIVD